MVFHYSIANLILERKSKRLSSKNRHLVVSDDKNIAVSKPTSGKTLFIGSLMDNIPENAALGITLAAGGALNIAFLVAILVSNLPEALGSTSELKASGMSRRIHTHVVVRSHGDRNHNNGVGYSVLANASPTVISISIAFAAGAILVMLADSMIPDAFKQGGFWKGIAVVGRFSNRW